MWILDKSIIYRKGVNIGVIGGTEDKTCWGYVRKDKYGNWSSFESIWSTPGSAGYEEMYRKFMFLSLHRKGTIYWSGSRATWNMKI